MSNISDMAHKVAQVYNKDVYEVMFCVITLEDLVQQKEILEGRSNGFDKSYFCLAYGRLIDAYKKLEVYKK